jgi:hypothetical protein
MPRQDADTHGPEHRLGEQSRLGSQNIALTWRRSQWTIDEMPIDAVAFNLPALPEFQ